jgi:GT2 family glycosyltransferase
MKLIIGIPTINRADLLNEALAKYFEDFKEIEIVICDNGNQEIITREKNFVIYRPEKNLGVSGSWNMIMDYAEKVNATHVLMLNDDIYLGKSEQEVNHIVNLWKPEFLCTELNWCAYILSLDAFKKTGGFDETFFPAYFEDNDYFRRMLLANVQMVFNGMLNPIVYRNSMTIAKDQSLNNNFENNKRYYISKWGGLPTQETFGTPFNQ